MALPDFPTVLAAYIAELTSADFEAGGHRVNFIPTAQGALTFADYCRLVSVELLALAEQVGEDAEAAAAGSGTETSVANIRAGLSATYVSVRRIYEANVPVALADATSIAWNMATGINFKIVLGAAGRTLSNPTNLVAGKSGILRVVQDATGGRSITAWGTAFVWIGGQPIWPTAPNARSLISYFVGDDGKVELSFGGSSA